MVEVSGLIHPDMLVEIEVKPSCTIEYQVLSNVQRCCHLRSSATDPGQICTVKAHSANRQVLIQDFRTGHFGHGQIARLKGVSCYSDGPVELVAAGMTGNCTGANVDLAMWYGAATITLHRFAVQFMKYPVTV